MISFRGVKMNIKSFSWIIILFIYTLFASDIKQELIGLWQLNFQEGSIHRQISFDFSKNGIVSYITPRETDAAEYTVIEGNKIKINMDEEVLIFDFKIVKDTLKICDKDGIYRNFIRQIKFDR